MNFYRFSRYLLVILSLSFLSFTVVAEEDDETEEDAPNSLYVEIEPVFVTNYGGVERLAYMKVEVTLRVLGSDGEEQVRHHMPFIKDTLLSLFAIQTNQTINSAEGKESLRKQSLEAVAKVLLAEDEVSHIEDLLFTSFVAQR